MQQCLSTPRNPLPKKQTIKKKQENEEKCAPTGPTNTPIVPATAPDRIDARLIEADQHNNKTATDQPGWPLGLSATAVRSSVTMMVRVSLERGRDDFDLPNTARDMEHYEALTRRFFYDNEDIKAFKTLVVMDGVKTGFGVPVHFDET